MKPEYDKDTRRAASALWAKLQELPAHQQHEAICAALKYYACEADRRLDESDWAAKYREACIEISKHSDEIEAYRATIGRMEYKLEVRAREIEQIKDSLVECSKRAEKAEDTVRLLGEVDTARAWQFAAGNPSAALHKRMEFARAFFAAPSNDQGYRSQPGADAATQKDSE